MLYPLIGPVAAVVLYLTAATIAALALHRAGAALAHRIRIRREGRHRG